MLDGITLERLGIPAAVIVTSALEVPVRAMARLQGAPDYPIVVVPHPINNLTLEELQRLAEAAAPTVIRLLTNRPSPSSS